VPDLPPIPDPRELDMEISMFFFAPWGDTVALQKQTKMIDIDIDR
jgi:hypothetical protein